MEKKAATLDATGKLNIWDSNSGRGFSIDPHSNEFAKQISRAGSGVRREVLSFPAPLSTGLFSPDGSCVVLFHENSMKVFDAHDGSWKTTLQGASSCGWAVFNHSSTMVCILEMNAKKAGVWDLKTGRLITRLTNRRGALAMIQFSPIEDRLITGDMAGRTCIWDPRDGSAPIDTLKRESSFMTTSRYSPCGRYIMAADGSSVAIYDASKPYELLSTLEGHTARVSDIRMSPDGSRIFTWSGNAKSILWDFEPEKGSQKANPLMSMNSKKRLQQALWTPDGRDLITSWSDGHIEVWNGATQADLQQLNTSDNFESSFDSWRRRFMISGN